MKPLTFSPNFSQSQSINQRDKKFEWTHPTRISLYQDEAEIFQQKPIILSSRLLSKKASVERSNNKIFMVLNTNVHSIRSYVDFNTQQTEFISVKFISISAPFVFQNLIPAPISLFFKNICRETRETSLMTDPKVYDLDIKHNS